MDEKDAIKIEALDGAQTAEEACGILGAGYESLRVETEAGELICKIDKETGISFGEKSRLISFFRRRLRNSTDGGEIKMAEGR